ncbi:MAG: hypothetical protein NVSMB14_12010 [Isosphaeraceae bacterium]
MPTNSGHSDASADALVRVCLATRPADPNVSWDAFWSDVVAESDSAANRSAPESRWNGRRKVSAGLTFGFSTLAAAAALFLVFSPAGDKVKDARPIEVADALPTPNHSQSPATAEGEDAALQDISVDPGQVLVLRVDKNGRLRTEETGWEPSLAIGDSAYGYGTSDDSFEFIGYLEALGLDTVAVGGGKTDAAPSRTP